MILVLSVVGALAVLCFLVHLGLRVARGPQDGAAVLLLRIAGGLGIVCAVIGVLLAVTGG